MSKRNKLLVVKAQKHSWLVPVFLVLVLLFGCEQNLFDTIVADIVMRTVEQITITSPNGSEVFSKADTITFRWTSRIGGGKVSISVYDGVNTIIVVPSIENGQTNFYQWVNNGLDNGDYSVRVSLESDSTIFDESDAVFAIRDLAVGSPNPGDVFAVGSTIPVRWSSGLASGTVKLELKRSGIVERTIASGVSVLSQAHDYIIPAGISASSDYRVSVTYEDNPAITQNSAVFGILMGITVNTPPELTNYLIGDSSNITWSSLFAGSVKIELLKNGVLDTVIAANTTNDGSHTWAVDTVSTSGGDDYTIKISTVTTPALTTETGALEIRRWESWEYATSVSSTDMHMYGNVLAYKDNTDKKLKTRAYSMSAKSWSDYKMGNVSPGEAGPISRLIKDGYYNYLHIAFSDLSNSGKADVAMAYSVSWMSLPGFASANAVSHLDFCYGGSRDVYYMGYRHDVVGSPLYLSKFSGTAWSLLGEIVSNGVHISLDKDLSGKPYILYRDLSGTDKRFRVKKYSSGTGTGITFSDLGIPDESSTKNSYRDQSYKLIADPAGNPVVMFYEYDYTLKIRRWNGTSWNTLYSQPGFLYKNATLGMLSDGTPILAFFDNSDSMNNRVRVFRHKTGTTWDDLGSLNHTLIGGLEISSIGMDAVIAVADHYSSPQYKVAVYRYK